MITDFKPTSMFLSTGEKTAMYTARYAGTYIGVDSDGLPYSFNGSSFITNLSTDRQTAIDKIAEMAAQSGVPYDTTAEFDLNEIRRISKEEAIERQRQIREHEEAVEREHAENIQKGIFVIGKFTGLTATEIAEIDEDYLRWMASHTPSNTPFGVCVALATEWAKNNPEPTSQFVGAGYGDKVQLTLKLKAVTYFESQFGTQQTLFRFLDEKGNIILCYSSAKAMRELDRGDVVTIQATVKKHEISMYEKPDNNLVTVISRPKVV